MLRRVLILIICTVIVTPASAAAGGPLLMGQPPASTPDLPGTNNNGTGGGDPTFGGGVDDDGDIEAGVNGSGSGSGGSSTGSASYGPSCTWEPVYELEGDSTISSTDIHLENDDGELGWIRTCGGNEVFVWVAPAVDPIDLVAGASARARARLPTPTPDMSPAPEIGSVVNLGLWFAIEDPGVTTARASLGTAWAQVQGRFDHVTINPGDGSDPVTCDGFGTPYPRGSSDPDEGPCGHTYLQRTPDDAPHQMTYTITYNLTWATSDGRSGSLGTYDRSLTFDFNIDEIQTVGTG